MLDWVWLLATVVIGFLLGHYLPSYFGEKGKNLATREDIAEITRLIEGVKAEFAKELRAIEASHAQNLERVRNVNGLRIAAIDKRLQVHQEAFALWRKLISNVYQPEIHQTVIECQDWWNKNCLYLNAEASESFNHAYLAASHHKQFIDARPAVAVINNNWAVIMKAGDDISKGVELPPLRGD